MAVVRDLFTRVGMDTTDFAAGTRKIKQELNSLNKDFAANKEAMKTLSASIKEMQAQYASLGEKMKAGMATKQERQEYKKLGQDIDSARTKMSQLKTVEQDLKSKTSAATSELKKMNAGLRETKQDGDKAGTSLKSVAAALKAVALGYTGKKLWESLIGSNAEMEQYNTSFEVMLGSAEKAQKMMKDMTDFAAKTPLQLTDAVSTGTLLMNYGVEAERVIPVMTQLGDLASGNAEKLNRVALAYGQMLAKGKVSGEELRQMTEAGIPLLQTLADTMGKSTAEVQDLISKGSVGIPQLNAAIESLTTGTGKFAGMMDKQSQTMNGMLSTLKDNIDQFGRDVGEGAFQEVKGTLQEIMDMIQQARDDGSLERISKEIGTVIKNAVSLLVGLIKALIQYKDVLIGVTSAVLAWKTAMKVESAIKSLTTALAGATAAQKAMNLAAKANPYVMLATAIIGVAGAIASVAIGANKATDELQAMRDEMEELKNGEQESLKNSEEEISVVKRKAEIYEELRTKSSLTADEQERLKQVAAELGEAIGDGTALLNEQTGTYVALGDSIQQVIEKMRIQARLEAGKASYTAAVAQYDELQKKLDETLNKYTKYKKGIASGDMGTGDWTTDLYAVDEIPYLKEDIKEIMRLMAENKKIMDDFEQLAIEGSGAVNSLSNSVDKTSQSAKNLTESFSNLVNVNELLTASQKEIANSGGLSLSTLEKMTKQYPELEKTVARYIAGLASAKDVYAELQNCYNTDMKSHAQLIAEKLKDSEEFYQNNMINNKTMIDNFMSNYGVDLRNYKSYADAKKKITEEINKSWATYFAAEKSMYNGEMDPAAFAEEERRLLAVLNKKQPALNALNNIKFDGVEAKINKLVSNTITAADKSKDTTKKNAKDEISQYELANEAYKKLANEKIDLINQEMDAKKKLLDETVKGIDKEIEARKRLKEDTNIQKEIEAVQAELKYAQMDDFSRMELEKRLKALQEEKEETDWRRSMADKKESLQETYNQAVEGSKATISELQAAIQYANSLFADLKNGAKSVSSIVNNNSKSANVNIINNALSAGQIARKIVDELMDGVI